MKIVEYDDVDPLEVLHLNLLGLGFPLTPERVALIRRLDPRPFPFVALYAIVDENVAGQVGVFRLPLVTTDGPEDVGGVWAVCTHPAFSHHGIATLLLEEAHARMRAAGLRFSTLGTSRYRGAYRLYRGQGYEDAASSVSALTRRSAARCDTRLQAERANPAQLSLADDIFRQAAAGKLGFARRHEPFIPAMIEIGEVNANEVWLLLDGGKLIGYALARVVETVLRVSDLLLCEGIDAAEAIAAITHESSADYVRASVNRPSDIASLRRAGFQLALPDWSTFMIKPLTPDVTIEEARRLLGIGTNQFLMSWMDTT